jgi:hypothetical protein
MYHCRGSVAILPKLVILGKACVLLGYAEMKTMRVAPLSEL